MKVAEETSGSEYALGLMTLHVTYYHIRCDSTSIGYTLWIDYLGEAFSELSETILMVTARAGMNHRK